MRCLARHEGKRHGVAFLFAALSALAACGSEVRLGAGESSGAGGAASNGSAVGSTGGIASPMGSGGEGGSEGGHGPGGTTLWANEYDQPWPTIFGLTFYGVAADPSGYLAAFGRLYHDAYLGGDILACDYCDNRFVARYAPDGSHMWSHQVASSTEIEIAHLDVDDLGNVYIAGKFSEDITLPGTQLTGDLSDLFVAKLLGNGSLAWVVSAGGPGLEHVDGLDVTPAGTVFVAGQVADGVSVGGNPLTGEGVVQFAACYDTDGNHVFSEALPVGFVPHSVGASDDALRFLVAGKSDGSFVDENTTLSPEAAVLLERTSEGAWTTVATFPGSAAHIARVGVESDRAPRLVGSFRGTLSFGPGAKISAEPNLPILAAILFAGQLADSNTVPWANTFADLHARSVAWGPRGDMASWLIRSDDEWRGSAVARLVPEGSPAQWQLDMPSVYETVATTGPNHSLFLAGVAKPAVELPGGVRVYRHYIAKLQLP